MTSTETSGAMIRTALIALGQARAQWRAAQHARRAAMPKPSLVLLNAEDAADAAELRARSVVLAIADGLAALADRIAAEGECKACDGHGFFDIATGKASEPEYETTTPCMTCYATGRAPTGGGGRDG